MDTVHTPENLKPTVTLPDTPLPQDVRDFFDTVKKHDIEHRSEANKLFGHVSFEATQENGDYILKELTLGDKNKREFREIGRAHVYEDGRKTLEEVNPFATSSDGANVFRKVDQYNSPEHLLTKVYEAPTKDHFKIESPYNLTSENETILKDGKPVASSNIVFEYSKDGKPKGETIERHKQDGSIEKETFEAQGADYKIKSDVIVYPDSSPSKPHQSLKTYEDIGPGSGSLSTGSRLIDVEQQGGTTTRQVMEKNNGETEWTLKAKTKDKGHGEKIIYLEH